MIHKWIDYCFAEIVPSLNWALFRWYRDVYNFKASFMVFQRRNSSRLTMIPTNMMGYWWLLWASVCLFCSFCLDKLNVTQMSLALSLGRQEARTSNRSGRQSMNTWWLILAPWAWWVFHPYNYHQQIVIEWCPAYFFLLLWSWFLFSILPLWVHHMYFCSSDQQSLL
jgi:hypothetical protein